ncbi:MAG: DUF2244 domain-containing protein [Rudaea sp.]
MIEQTSAPPQDAKATVAVFPHRSLSRAGLAVYFAAQSIATLGFALLAAWRGIVLAPVFAVLVLAATAWCVVRVWRASVRGQLVTITPRDVEIAAAGGVTAHYHPYWMRVRLVAGRWPGWSSRLFVGSHGRETEVGAFLNDAERRELAQRLERLLRDANSRNGDSGLGTR